MTQILRSYLEHLCDKANVEHDVPMKTKTTFRIGGNAKFFVTVKSKSVLLKLVSALKFIEEPYFVIGLGANVLACDSGFDGVVIKLGFSEVVQNGHFVYADAGATLAKVGAFCKRQGLAGLEWACGVPATVGGAIYMNAGAYGHQMSDSVVCVDVLINGEVKTLGATKLKLGYRTSIFHKKRGWVVLGAYFHLKPDTQAQIEKKEAEYRAARINALPTNPSAGSTFKKPAPNFYVGQVIESLGLKGKQVGDARISEKHAGVIINNGSASCKDVLSLVRLIKKKVWASHGVKLELEYTVLKNPVKLERGKHRKVKAV